LHGNVSLVSGHSSPPWSVGTVTGRDRVSVPPPHSAVHVLQGSQSPTSQCTGHGTTSQEPISDVTFDSHAMPPYIGCSIVRLR
jgi:hypothetical protein